MKKLLVLLAVASLGFVACNNSASEDAEKAKADSIHQADSIAAAQRAADSLAKAQAPVTMDTTKPADTTKPKH